jgi:hypothetical protein
MSGAHGNVGVKFYLRLFGLNLRKLNPKPVMCCSIWVTGMGACLSKDQKSVFKPGLSRLEQPWQSICAAPHKTLPSCGRNCSQSTGETTMNARCKAGCALLQPPSVQANRGNLLDSLKSEFPLNHQLRTKPLKDQGIDWGRATEVAAQRGVPLSALTLSQYLSVTHQKLPPQTRALLEKNGVSMNSNLQEVAIRLIQSFVAQQPVSINIQTWIQKNVPPVLLTLAAGASFIVGGQTVSIAKAKIGEVNLEVTVGVKEATVNLRSDW